MLERVGTLRCVGKDGNTEVCRKGCEHRCFGKGVFGRAETLKCVGKDGNTEVCWEGWEQ